MVVAAVVAVRGLSVAGDIAAPEDGGIRPVSSSLRILDFKSSSSSQTVEGAVVDMDDSVPPSPFGRSGELFCSIEPRRTVVIGDDRLSLLIPFGRYPFGI